MLHFVIRVKLYLGQNEAELLFFEFTPAAVEDIDRFVVLYELYLQITAFEFPYLLKDLGKAFQSFDDPLHELDGLLMHHQMIQAAVSDKIDMLEEFFHLVSDRSVVACKPLKLLERLQQLLLELLVLEVIVVVPVFIQTRDSSGSRSVVLVPKTKA